MSGFSKTQLQSVTNSLFFTALRYSAWTNKQAHMNPTQRLARLLGPAISITVLAEYYNGSIFRDKSAHVVFLNGNILFIAGLALVQNHNLWRTWAAALVTCVSWLIMLIGLARMLMPAGGINVDLEDQQEGFMVVVILVLIGGILTVVGYRRD